MNVFLIIIIALALGLATVGIGKWIDELAYGIVLGIVVAIGSGVILLLTNVGYLNPRDLTCYVENKDRTTTSGGNSDARIYTKDCGVLNVQDLFWAGEFNTADTFSSIEPGHTYRFHVTGVRIGFFSMFPHIRSAHKVS